MLSDSLLSRKYERIIERKNKSGKVYNISQFGRNNNMNERKRQYLMQLTPFWFNLILSSLGFGYVSRHLNNKGVSFIIRRPVTWYRNTFGARSAWTNFLCYLIFNKREMGTEYVSHFVFFSFPSLFLNRYLLLFPLDLLFSSFFFLLICLPLFPCLYFSPLFLLFLSLILFNVASSLLNISFFFVLFIVFSRRKLFIYFAIRVYFIDVFLLFLPFPFA